MRNLVEIFNTNDLRWLLDVDILPEEYETEYLIPVLDEIIFEYEELKKDKFYTNYLKKYDYSAKDAAKLVVLRGCSTLYALGYKEESLNLLQQIKSKSDTSEKIDREMKLLMQRLQVQSMKEAGKEKVKQNFGELCARIKTQLPNADPRNATVAEFVGYENIIKELKSNG